MTKYRWRSVCLVSLFLLSLLCSGCRVNIDPDKNAPTVEEMLASPALTAEGTEFSAEGSYTVTIRYDKGGFRDMDLSRAYVAYYPFTVTDQIDAITGGDSGDIPPLPADAQSAIDEATGANELRKIAVIVVKTLDDTTLTVSFKDGEALPGQEYYFIIPNEGLAGVIRPE